MFAIACHYHFFWFCMLSLVLMLGEHRTVWTAAATAGTGFSPVQPGRHLNTSYQHTVELSRLCHCRADTVGHYPQEPLAKQPGRASGALHAFEHHKNMAKKSFAGCRKFHGVRWRPSAQHFQQDNHANASLHPCSVEKVC